MSSKKPGCLAAIFGIRAKPQTTFPYKAKQYFFSNAEASFFHLLRQMSGDSVLVFPHVALRDLIMISGINKTNITNTITKLTESRLIF